jgi:hypothetical protein
MRGADFGPPFLCGIVTVGVNGGDHTMTMLNHQLMQGMALVRSERVTDLPKHLVTNAAQ